MSAPRVALLIDTDSASSRHRHEIERIARSEGEIVRCRGYGRTVDRTWQGDGALPGLAWAQTVFERNAADMALAMSAIDMLHLDRIDRFCIVCGDGDYTGLVKRLRRSGKQVTGIGEVGKTSKAFRRACSRFILVDEAGSAQMHEQFVGLVRQAVDDGGQWRSIAWLGTELHRLKPGIRYRDYGAPKLRSLLERASDAIELRGSGADEEMRMKTQRTPVTEPEASQARPEHVEPLLLRLTEALDNATSKWHEPLPEDLAQATPEQWTSLVKTAEQYWAKVGELQGELTDWLDETDQTHDAWRYTIGPIPLGLDEIHIPVPGEPARVVRSPLLGAIEHQHDPDPARRRRARTIILEHFVLRVLESR